MHIKDNNQALGYIQSNNFKNSFNEFSKQYRYESKIMNNKGSKIKEYKINDILGHSRSE
jgi:hypothetical protein